MCEHKGLENPDSRSAESAAPELKNEQLLNKATAQRCSHTIGRPPVDMPTILPKLLHYFPLDKVRSTVVCAVGETARLRGGDRLTLTMARCLNLAVTVGGVESQEKPKNA